MGGIIFHEKKAGYSDGYRAWGDLVLPTWTQMIYGIASNGYSNTFSIDCR